MQPLGKAGAAARLASIGVVLAAVVGAFAFLGGWFTPNDLTPARLTDAFEHVDGVHPGFRRNHAKGVGVSGFFDSNGNGVRLSKAVVFRPGRVPVIGRFSLGGGQPDVGDTPDAVRGLGLQFSLSDGELWRTAMVQPRGVSGPHPGGLLPPVDRVEARPEHEQTRSGADEGLSRTLSRDREGARDHQEPAGLVRVRRQHVSRVERVSIHQSSGRVHPGALAADADAAVRGGKPGAASEQECSLRRADRRDTSPAAAMAPRRRRAAGRPHQRRQRRLAGGARTGRRGNRDARSSGERRHQRRGGHQLRSPGSARGYHAIGRSSAERPLGGVRAVVHETDR